MQKCETCVFHHIFYGHQQSYSACRKHAPIHSGKSQDDMGLFCREGYPSTDGKGCGDHEEINSGNEPPSPEEPLPKADVINRGTGRVTECES